MCIFFFNRKTVSDLQSRIVTRKSSFSEGSYPLKTQSSLTTLPTLFSIDENRLINFHWASDLPGIPKEIVFPVGESVIQPDITLSS